MRGLKILTLVTVVAGLMAHAAVSLADPVDNPSAVAIRHVLDDQVAAWNRGDVEAFIRGYKDSPDTTFIGQSVQHGYAPILERYKKSYPDKASMGTLGFSELAIRTLSADYAVVTGKYHLARTADGGGEARGIFSLVFEKTAAGWKIILDHSSATTA